jgi:ATP-dependent RNA helicase RhlE
MAFSRRPPGPFEGAQIAPFEGLFMHFADLRLAEPVLRAISYPRATPIQAQAIPHILAGRDVMGCAQTGTGKTAAFALPILHRLFKAPRPGGPRRVRTLVLCPTRELATQTDDAFREYGRHLDVRMSVIFGGVGERPQIDSLRRGVDVLIATPGRLLDLMRQGHADLRSIETLVLDEADRMLDMGFIHDIRRIVAQIPAQRQTLMFSATMPPEIRTLARSLLGQPVEVQVAPVSSPVDAIDQSVYFVDRRNKPALLAHLFNELPMARAIVFTRTKHGADRVVRHLHGYGIRSEAIHGNKTQNARQRALGNFRANKTPVLVATDIAARGIDVDGITHVVNYDLTHEPETYVHRIGRTARAGAAGAAVAFCDPEEVVNLKAIERLIRRPIPVKNDHPKYHSTKRTATHVHDNPVRHPQRAAARPAWSTPRPGHKPWSHAGPRPAPAGKPYSSRRSKHPIAGSRRGKANQPLNRR